MTHQTKHFIELSDIIGIQIECKSPTCGISLLAGGETLTSLADAHNTTFTQCPTCNHPWTVPSTYPTQMGFDTEIKKLLRLLNQVRGFEDKLGCRLRFEVKDDISLDRASDSKV
jgi:hypothetical protein